MTINSIMSVFPLSNTQLHLQAILTSSLPVVLPHLQCHRGSPAELGGCGLLPTRAQIPARVLEEPTEWWGACGCEPVAETTYYFLPTWHESFLPPPVCEGEGFPWTKPLLCLILSTLSKESEGAGSEELQEGARIPWWGSLLVWFNKCSSIGILSPATW